MAEIIVRSSGRLVVGATQILGGAGLPTPLPGLARSALMENPAGTIAWRSLNIGLRTTEAFTVHINPTTGVDPLTTITNAAEAAFTVAAPFKTMEAIAAALPDRIAHVTTIKFPAGDFSINANEKTMGNWLSKAASIEEFFDADGKIRFEGTGLELVPGTAATYTVISATSNTVTVAATGFAANARRSDFIEMIDGPEAGTVNAVRLHTNDTVFEISNHWGNGGTIDPGDTFRFVQPATRLNDMDGVSLFGSHQLPVEFKDLDIVDGGTFFIFYLASVNLKTENTRFFGLRIWMTGAQLFLSPATVIDGAGAPGIGIANILAGKGSFVRATTASSGFLIRDGGSGIELTEGSTCFLFAGSIDDCTGAAILARSGSNPILDYTRLRSIGCAQFMDLQAGSLVVLRTFIAGETEGTAAYILVDGSEVTSAEITAAADGDHFVGAGGSAVTKES